MPAPEGLPLTAEGLRVEAPGGRVILQVDRLAIAPGTSVGVRGPSGAGKSTLLHALAGLTRPAAGRILWGDTDIAALSDADRAAFRRDRVGLVFQDHLLFEELGGLDNAAVATAFMPRSQRPAMRERAEAALATMGLRGIGARRVDSFSGGERQRIAVVRALVGEPAVLLADEPTASLDRATADRLAGDLAALTGQRRTTLVAVSHDAGLIARMDRVLTVEDGRITGDSYV